MLIHAKARRRGLAIGLVALAIAGFLLTAPRSIWPAAGPASVTVPAGTRITVQMIDAVDSSRNHVGEEFAATVASPVVVGNDVVIAKGAEARVRLIQAKSAGRLKGQSELELQLDQVTVNGKNYSVDSGPYVEQGQSRGKRSAKVIGGGGALGALIGAAAGGGKGAAIGGLIGAGAGTAVQATTHGQQVRVPAEAKVEFALRSGLTVKQ
jgi:hypothetical protein